MLIFTVETFFAQTFANRRLDGFIIWLRKVIAVVGIVFPYFTRTKHPAYCSSVSTSAFRIFGRDELTHYLALQ